MIVTLPAPVVETRREDVQDVVHGHAIPDPYRWLEDGSSDETRLWTREQNARTASVLTNVPDRDIIEEQLRTLMQVGSITGGRYLGGRFFYMRREGNQDQASLRVREGFEGDERILVDPTAHGERGMVALDWWYPAADGGLVAFGLSENGDEWSTLYVIDVATGEELDLRIPRARASTVAWLPDHSGFYYTRYPAPDSVAPGEENYNRHVFFHQIGLDPASDTRVFGEGRPLEELSSVSIDPTGRWVVIEADEGWVKTELFVMDRERGDESFREITPPGDAVHSVMQITDGALYSVTNWEASNRQVIRLPLKAGDDGDWSTVIPDREDRVIEYATLTHDGIVTSELQNAISVLRRYGRDGSPEGELKLPGLGLVQSMHGSADSDVIVAGYSSFVQPPTALVYCDGGSSPLELQPIGLPEGFDADAYDIRQVWYPSKDGTHISMFIVHRRGIMLDKKNPLYLTGYGGFNVTRGSEYLPALPLWLAHGGVFALPNLRGGSEFGASWHRDGMLDKKQNTFDDFISAAEWLIAEGYTSPDHLGIAGGSNGGLLVGASMTQRPELFRAVVCKVPLLDMIRYHRFRIARLWISEYGSSDDPGQFEWLIGYSPYQAVREGVHYPATLLTLGENDSRVDPMHARKMTALLQASAARGEDRPILLRAEENAGHGQGKPLWKRVAEAADEWGFMGWQLGVDWKRG